MVTISREEVKDIYYSDLIYKFHNIKHKINFYEKKYSMNFIEFEKHILNKKNENITEWDDYIEWKGFSKIYEELLFKKEEIKNGNINIS